MSHHRKALTLAFLVVAALALAGVAIAAVTGPPRGTRIVSPPGGKPNAAGPSDKTDYVLDAAHGATPTSDPIVGTERPMDNIEFSQDNRIVQYAAFQSKDALANSSADGHSHIYLFKRKRGQKTTAGLLSGKLSRVDPNAGGDSVKPSLDGQTITGDRATKPNCVVFQSTSNLAGANTGGKWVVYLYRIKSGNISRVSEAGDDARDPVVDGSCATVTYEQGGTVKVRKLGGAVKEIAQGYDPDQQTDGEGVAYDRVGGPGNHNQVWYTSFSFKGGFKKGSEKLVSVNKNGTSNSDTGNDDSTMPSVNDNGAYIAFESKADNLCNGSRNRCGTNDENGHITDVFRRTMPGKGAPTSDVMQMISYDGKEGFQSDLDSDQVKITGGGEQACFRSFGVETHNHKFRPDRHTGPFQHIYYWNFPRERMIGAFSGESKEGPSSSTELKHSDGTAAFNFSCGISNRGNFVGFTSDTDRMAGDQNGSSLDVFIRFMGGSDEGKSGDVGGR
jgi:hypothetical protein